jgi:hypothetical protein
VKAIGTFGLGLLAAVAATAALGVGTASATNDFTALCKVKVLACFLESQYPTGTIVKGKLKTGTKAVLSGSLKVECEESAVGLELRSDPLGSTLLGKFTELTFKKCTTCPTVTSLLAAFGEWHLKNIGNLRGLLTVLTPAVHLDGCFGFAKCTVSASAVELDADTSVEPATVKAVNEKLSVSGFGCGSEGTWNAEYVLTAPTPLYIES